MDDLLRFLRFINVVPPADLLVEPCSSTYLRPGIGGSRTGDLSRHRLNMAGFDNYMVGVASGFYGGGKGSTAGVTRAYQEGEWTKFVIEAIKSPVVVAAGAAQGGASAVSAIWK